MLSKLGLRPGLRVWLQFRTGLVIGVNYLAVLEACVGSGGLVSGVNYLAVLEACVGSRGLVRGVNYLAVLEACLGSSPKQSWGSR